MYNEKYTTHGHAYQKFSFPLPNETKLSTGVLIWALGSSTHQGSEKRASKLEIRGQPRLYRKTCC